MHNAHENIHFILGMLLHYLGKLKIQIFCTADSADMTEVQTNCILIASDFVIRTHIYIFSVFKIASLSPLTANKIVIKILSASLKTTMIVDKHGVTSAAGWRISGATN